VLAALQHPIKVAQHSCWVTASIGIRFAARGEPAEVLLRDADTAMYVAKAQGKGRYEVYEPAMHTAALTRVRMAEQLRHGLARDELVVQYQLIVDLATEAPTGVEAVVRWNHPEHGLIHGVALADVVLEITETQMWTGDPQTLLTLDTLRQAGVILALDDFGTGYSSLGYLQRSDVDVVKIDRTLIAHLDTDPRQHRVASAILGVVGAFDLVAVAEGIETPGEAAQLLALGCRRGQGWLWGLATDAESITPHLRSRRLGSRP